MPAYQAGLENQGSFLRINHLSNFCVLSLKKRVCDVFLPLYRAELEEKILFCHCFKVEFSREKIGSISSFAISKACF